jgi:hypothetical protein
MTTYGDRILAKSLVEEAARRNNYREVFTGHPVHI